MARNILILLGNPVREGICGTLADAYESAAREAGHDVTRMNIADLEFDPLLREGYRTIQDLEPDLLRFQQALRAADHFVLVYPNWWSGPPAILKGLFDRAWLPGFAYRYMKSKSGLRLPLWERLMRGKTARIIATTGTHPILLRLLYGDFLRSVSTAILWFAGFKVSETVLGPAENVSEEHKAVWIARIRTLGTRGI